MKTRASSSHFGCEEPFCHGVRKVALKGKETKDTSGISVTTLLDFYFFCGHVKNVNETWEVSI